MLKFSLLVALVGVALGAPPAAVKVDHPILDGRIVGGIDTTIQEHPYIVSLLRTNSHICGGAIITDVWIVTAAHCVVGGTVSAYSVRAGSSIRNSGGQVISARRIFVHASYDSRTTDYDVAVIELNFPITTANARVIGLVPAGAGPTPGSIATITGWGATSEGGAAANVLQVVQVPVVSIDSCRTAYGTTAVTDRMFCAGVLGVGGLDACQGDSGGPVVVNGALAGLVSWGAGCARPNHPGVKASLYSLGPWIYNVIDSVGTYSEALEL